MLKLLAAVSAALSLSLPSIAEEAKTVPLSEFVPQDVLAAVQTIPEETRTNACQVDVGDLQSLATMKPVDRISGFTSQMLNTQDVGKALDKFAEDMSSAMTSAYAQNDPLKKEFVLRVLAKWAKAGAFTKTYDCSGMGKECQEWKSDRGTELAPVKDYQTVQEALIPLAMGYYTTLADFEPSKFAEEHAAIQKWFGIYFKRMPRNALPTKDPLFFGFGVKWQTWGQPLVDLVNANPKNFEARMANLAKRLGGLIGEDGSLAQRTVRGARAAFYHGYGLNETFFALEMLKANGTDLYPDLTPKLEKAVGIYLDALEDIRSGRNTSDNPARIYKWAKADFHSAADPRVQIYPTDALLNGNADFGGWMFVYLYRFPNGENADRLRALIADFRNLPEGDRGTGLNTGCLYRLADPSQRDRELSQGVPLSDVKLAAINESINAAPASFAKPLTYDTAELTLDDTDKEGSAYSVLLQGVVIGGEPARSLRFDVLTNFNGGKKDEKHIELFRITIDDSSLSDPETHVADLNACSNIARQQDSRLHYGREAPNNDCILISMGPKDRVVWESVFAAFPKILEAEAPKNDVAAELLPLIKAKLSEKNGD